MVKKGEYTMASNDLSEIRYCSFCSSRKISLDDIDDPAGESPCYILICKACGQRLYFSLEEPEMKGERADVYEYVTGDEIEKHDDYSEYNLRGLDEDFFDDEFANVI